MSPDKDGRFKGISVPKSIPSEEKLESAESKGDSGDGGDRTRAKGRPWVPCECEFDNGECDCFRANETSEKECSFCKGKPVQNGWGWHTGRILEPLPCPRCGQLRRWEDDGGK